MTTVIRSRKLRKSAKKRMLIIDGMAHCCANFACSSDSE
jgi:hypothetical protein